MPRPRTRLLRPLAYAAALAALIPATALATAAPKKGKAPSLKVEQRLCQTGPTTDDRALVVTAMSVLQGSGDRVAMRFRLQQRATNGRWVAAVTSDTERSGRWEASTTDGSALRFTKHFNNLWEDARYRVVIQARGVDRAGKAVSETVQRTVNCTQPQVSPDVRITKVKRRSSSDGVVAQVTLRNAGTIAAGTSQITVTPVVVGTASAAGPNATSGSKKKAARRQTSDTAAKPLLVASTGPLKGHASRTVSLPLGACTGLVRIVVEPRIGADGEPAGPKNTTVFKCSTAKSAGKPGRR